jgi:predicted anti-sigma-YlaC factor YlaD
MNAIADVAYVSVIAERVYAITPTYFDHAPVALRAGLMAAAPPALGGRPADAKVELDRAIELTGRRSLLFLVTEARLIAIPLQDRALYQSLLQEVIAFDVDSYPEQRLPNLLAQRRARRYLEEIDNFFDPAPEGEGGGEGDTSGGEDTPPRTNEDVLD